MPNYGHEYALFCIASKLADWFGFLGYHVIEQCSEIDLTIVK